MNHYSKYTLIAISILTFVIASAVIYWFFKPQNSILSKVPASDSESVVQVKTVKLNKGVIKQSFTAYGSVLPLSNKLKTISVSYASKVDKIQS